MIFCLNKFDRARSLFEDVHNNLIGNYAKRKGSDS